MLLSKIANFVRRAGKARSDKVPHRIYGTVVAQARNIAFYTEFAIADTVMGRYDMLALHMFLLNRRLKTDSDNEQASQLSQNIFDLFIDDIERGLRDLGFADTSVHKRKKRLVHTYYALIEDFDGPLNRENYPQLEKALGERYYETLSKPKTKLAAKKLARYLRNVVNCLDNQSSHSIMQGILEWPKFNESPHE